VSAGGGSGVDDTVFNACGPVTVDLVAPTFELRQIPPAGTIAP